MARRPFRSPQTAGAFSGGGRECNRPEPVRSMASGPASLRAFSPPVPSAPAGARQPVQGGERPANLKRLRQRAKPIGTIGGKPSVFREAGTAWRGWVRCRDVPGANAPGNPVANCDADPGFPATREPDRGHPMCWSPTGRVDVRAKKRPDESGRVLFEAVRYSEFSEASASVTIVSNAFWAA